MLDPYDILERGKREKAVDDPHVRWKDPACWECLSDEQRDVINEWYMDISMDHFRQRDADREAAQDPTPGILGLSPFAFFQAMRYSRSFPGLLFHCAAALAVYSSIFIILSSAYRSAKQMQSLPMSRFGSFCFHLAAFGISFFVTWCVFSLTA